MSKKFTQNRKTLVNVLSRGIWCCLKRERDIGTKATLSDVKTAFRWNPALTFCKVQKNKRTLRHADLFLVTALSHWYPRLICNKYSEEMNTLKDIENQCFGIDVKTIYTSKKLEQDLKLKEIKPRIVNQHSVVYCFTCDFM